MATLSVADVLDKAADLIEPEGAWTQGAYARDALGKDVNPNEEFITVPDAACWCLHGSICHVVGGKNMWPWLRNPVRCELPDTEWNDAPERTQAEVVAKLREAATLARNEQPR